ncbi:hypothetical protein OF83DRAFT_1180121 [Amylostereum chailletii]|nr:hypothetical protein OF83DRAFT_1180121 [Amylostereum chailletii]
MALCQYPLELVSGQTQLSPVPHSVNPDQLDDTSTGSSGSSNASSSSRPSDDTSDSVSDGSSESSESLAQAYIRRRYKKYAPIAELPVKYQRPPKGQKNPWYLCFGFSVFFNHLCEYAQKKGKIKYKPSSPEIDYTETIELGLLYLGQLTRQRIGLSFTYLHGAPYCPEAILSLCTNENDDIRQIPGKQALDLVWSELGLMESVHPMWYFAQE